MALRIKTLTLGNGIEYAKIRGRVRARGRAPLPAAVIGGEIAVHQLVHEVCFP